MRLKWVTLLFFLGILLVATSCHSQQELELEVQKLMKNTKKNMIFVEGGTFAMGKDGLPGSNPAHQVTLTSYSMNKYETTFSEYDTYTRSKGLDSVLKGYRSQEELGPNYGAWNMTWQGARDYCVWLGERIGVSMDLPTEAQWEYAARSRGLAVQHATDSGKIEGSYTEKRNYPVHDTIVGAYPPTH